MNQPQRIDVRRNRARLVDAASSVVAEQGPQASLNEISQRAGVGAGTLYRHFPTREALLVAVFEERIGSLCAQATRLVDELPPLAALTEWLHAFLRHALTDHGLAETVAMTRSKTDLECTEKIRSAVDTLLDGARDHGEIRADLDADVVLRLAIGVALASDTLPDATALVDLVIDGVRPRPDDAPASPSGS